MISSSGTTVTSDTPETTSAASSQGTRVSIFGIILVGLIAGLIVGLITSPNTLQGFFLGFAGGSLITVAVYFFATDKGRASR